MPTATKDAEIKFRTSDELKRQTRRVYDRWGLTLSEAFNLFMRKSVEVGGLPFDLRPEPSPVLTPQRTRGSTMTSCDPAPRDIWLAYDEFADHEGVGKVRPVVILDASGKASVITAKVTTSANYGLSDFVEISDWESCGLRRPSWVQVEPLVEVRRDKLLRDEPLGQLSLSTYELVCAALGSVNQHPLPEPDKPLPGAMRRGEEGSRVRLGHA